MTDPRFLETAAGPEPSRAGPRSLPVEMLRDASRRLSTAGLVIAGLFLNGLVLNVIVFPRIDFATPIPGAWPNPAASISVGIIAVSLAIAWFAASKVQDFILALLLPENATVVACSKALRVSSVASCVYTSSLMNTANGSVLRLAGGLYTESR